MCYLKVYRLMSSIKGDLHGCKPEEVGAMGGD